MPIAEDRYEAATRDARGCGCPHAQEWVDELDRRWLRAASAEARELIATEAETLSDPRRNALILTPGHILDEMNTVRAVIAQLDKDVARSAVDEDFKTSWRVFFDEYEAFYENHSGWFGRWWAGTYEKSVEYRRRALSWRKRLVDLGGRATSPVDAPPESPGEQLASAAKWLFVGGGIYLAFRASGLWERFEEARKRTRQAEASRINASLVRTATRGGRR